MPIINFSNPFSIFIGVVLFVLVLYLAKRKQKRHGLQERCCLLFIGLLVFHTIEFALLGSDSQEVYKAITISAGVDLLFVFLSFISYLWVDDMEAKERKKKKY